MYVFIQSHNNTAPGTNTHRYTESLINTHAHTYGTSWRDTMSKEIWEY